MGDFNVQPTSGQLDRFYRAPTFGGGVSGRFMEVGQEILPDVPFTSPSRCGRADVGLGRLGGMAVDVRRGVRRRPLRGVRVCRCASVASWHVGDRVAVGTFAVAALRVAVAEPEAVVGGAAPAVEDVAYAAEVDPARQAA